MQTLQKWMDDEELEKQREKRPNRLKTAPTVLWRVLVLVVLVELLRMLLVVRCPTIWKRLLSVGKKRK
jgi:hypothetical protein